MASPARWDAAQDVWRFLLKVDNSARDWAEVGVLLSGASHPGEGDAAIRAALGVSVVVVHPRESAACATAEGTFWVPGPYCEEPVITTGAGDHFNGGFCQGQLLGLDPEGCLALGVCTSGHYVRTAVSPTLDDLETFLANRA